MRATIPVREFDAMMGILLTFNRYFAATENDYLNETNALDILNGGTLQARVKPRNEPATATIYTERRGDRINFHIDIPERRRRVYEV